MAEDNGAGTGGATGDTGGAGGGEGNWYDSISDDSLKGHEAIKAHADLGSLAKDYVEKTAKIAELQGQIPAIPDTPEGYELPTEMEGFTKEELTAYAKEFSADAKAAGVPKDAANKLFQAIAARELSEVSANAKALEQAETDAVTAMKKTYGDRYEEVVSKAKEAVITINPEFGKFAEGVGLFRSPDFIKFCKSITDKISPDAIVQTAQLGGEKTLAQTLYPTMTQ